MEPNEIVRALRECGNAGSDCRGKCAYSGRARCDMSAMWDAADLIESLQANLEAAIAGQETLQKALDESQRRRAAEKCIYDAETYLELGSGKFAYSIIQKWHGPQQTGEGGQDER